MKLSVILLFLQLWGNVEVSLSQNVCLKLPDVPHAHVSEETNKAEYQEGDMIHFTCETGYTSSQTSTYVCLRGGWLTVRQGMCYSCSTLPAVLHAHISEDTKKADYQEGYVIHFTCEPGYTSGPTIKYVCTIAGWLAIHQATCNILGSSCDSPPADGGITVIGLPENDEPILPDHLIIFSCDGPGKYLSGSSALICGKDGLWDNPLPTCEEKCKVTGVSSSVRLMTHVPNNELRRGQRLTFRCSQREHFLRGNAVVECLANGEWSHPFPTCGSLSCDLPPADGGVTVIGLPENDEPILPDHIITFSCDGPGKYLSGSSVLKCGNNGQWDNQFPSCEEKCEVTGIPRGVHYDPPDNEVRRGQNLRFSCRNQRNHFLQGNAVVECLADGQWSHPFPTCGPFVGCGRPPLLADGDIKESLQFQYEHNDRVEYICQRYYTMEGEPFQTCIYGKWTGQMRCLKPCTSTKGDMSQRNIAFRFTDKYKLYSAHNDIIEFRCTRGSPVGTVSMRQTCVDGEISLPTCQ